MRNKILPLLLLISLFSSAHAEEGTVYYTELTCKPEQDLFEMVPKNISKAELEKKTDAQSEALKKQDYAVFLNGEAVGGKTFKDTCVLENGVSVEVDIDYERKQEIVSEKDHPELYELLRRNGVGFSHFEIYNRAGTIAITQKGQLIAALNNSLTDNSAFPLILNDRGLEVTYPTTERRPGYQIKKNLEELQAHPISGKGFFATSN